MFYRNPTLNEIRNVLLNFIVEKIVKIKYPKLRYFIFKIGWPVIE